jgi:hypothetical protein
VLVEVRDLPFGSDSHRVATLAQLEGALPHRLVLGPPRAQSPRSEGFFPRSPRGGELREAKGDLSRGSSGPSGASLTVCSRDPASTQVAARLGTGEGAPTRRVSVTAVPRRAEKVTVDGETR